MFGRKIMFLAAGYVAGNVVASVYSSGKKRRKKQTWNTGDVKLIVEGFLDTQKNFIADMEKKCLSDENQKKFNKKKKELLKQAEKYTKEWQKLLEEIGKSEAVATGKEKASWVFSNLLSKWQDFLTNMRKEVEKEEKTKK